MEKYGHSPTWVPAPRRATKSQDENAELWWWVLSLFAMLAVAESIVGSLTGSTPVRKRHEPS